MRFRKLDSADLMRRAIGACLIALRLSVALRMLQIEGFNWRGAGSIDAIGTLLLVLALPVIILIGCGLDWLRPAMTYRRGGGGCLLGAGFYLTCFLMWQGIAVALGNGSELGAVQQIAATLVFGPLAVILVLGGFDWRRRNR
jgi:hypothetical protein